ncbi:E3 ubiquitin-protein ligase RNF115-like isoform X2 [Limulus polyphemus]|uniref:E3 ubiquitin-protein ligase RNF115-like isoform X2 n=1 Tax=Limulus polyphemus TaxID=6850 RepID=A0ABM1B6T2_LIMPO|nr:E3 ubiquitin-protein ligase RNF115-like isoform X2 [Limulus polyphemus]
MEDYICPRCQSGFIEELNQTSAPQENEDSEDVDPTAQFTEFWSAGSLLDTLRRLDHELSREETSRDNQQNGSGVENPSSSSLTDSANSHMNGGSQSQQPNWRRVRSQNRQNAQNYHQPLEGIIHQIFSNLTGGTGFFSNGGFPIILNLHGNPGDYAWGRGGLDSIVTQLLNQLEATGPPPLSKEKISKIPIVHIEQDQVDHNLQCSVCMEDFNTGEAVKKLSCQHHYHNDCIIPWLELHATCPICRKILNEEIAQGSCGNESYSSSSSTSSTIHGSSSSQNGEPLIPTSHNSTDNQDSAVNHLNQNQRPSLDYINVDQGSSQHEGQCSSVYDFIEDLDFD